MSAAATTGRDTANGGDPGNHPIICDEVLKHHCVVDMIITVYDGMRLVDAVPDGDGVNEVLIDGTSRWEIHADASAFPTGLHGAIREGAAAAGRS